MVEHGLHDKPEIIWNLGESSLSIDPRKTKVVGGIMHPRQEPLVPLGKKIPLCVVQLAKKLHD